MEDGTFEVRIEAVVSIKGVEDTWGAVQEVPSARPTEDHGLHG